MVEYCSLFSFQRQRWLILMLFQIDDDQLFCNDSDCPHISLPSAIFDSNNLWPCSGKESQRQMSTITSRQSIGLKFLNSYNWSIFVSNNYVLSFAFAFDRDEEKYQFALAYPYSYSRWDLFVSPVHNITAIWSFTYIVVFCLFQEKTLNTFKL